MTFPIPFNLSSFPSPARQVVSSKKLTRPLVMKNNKSPAGKGTITVSRPSERVFFCVAGFACAANEATLTADQRRGNQRQPGGEFRGGGEEAGQQGTTGAKVGVCWRLIPAPRRFHPISAFRRISSGSRIRTWSSTSRRQPDGSWLTGRR